MNSNDMKAVTGKLTEAQTTLDELFEEITPTTKPRLSEKLMSHKRALNNLAESLRISIKE